MVPRVEVAGAFAIRTVPGPAACAACAAGGPSSDVDALARVSRRLELADTARDSASDISRDAA